MIHSVIYVLAQLCNQVHLEFKGTSLAGMPAHHAAISSITTTPTGAREQVPGSSACLLVCATMCLQELQAMLLQQIHDQSTALPAIAV